MTVIEPAVLTSPSEVQDIAERLMRSAEGTVRIEFLDNFGDGTVRAVVVWPTENTALSDICALFESFRPPAA